MNKVGNVANDDFDMLSSEKAERNFSWDDLVNRKSPFGLRHTRESRRLCREYVPAWYLASGPDPRKDQNPSLPSAFRVLGSRLEDAQHTALGPPRQPFPRSEVIRRKATWSRKTNHSLECRDLNSVGCNVPSSGIKMRSRTFPKFWRVASPRV
jgi:hypothetical protein